MSNKSEEFTGQLLLSMFVTNWPVVSPVSLVLSQLAHSITHLLTLRKKEKLVMFFVCLFFSVLVYLTSSKYAHTPKHKHKSPVSDWIRVDQVSQVAFWNTLSHSLSLFWLTLICSLYTRTGSTTSTTVAKCHFTLDSHQENEWKKERDV